ncbi:LacI family DNA-binding transcriptional regulator [Klebsiella oxytoca]|uniref:LacI family DNA-binding transcriptional regulator n=1 Tax=Klebsiella oxytoca TaxID=571 RepID=UPI003570A076
MSIQKIARLAGVSVATVSRVLNNQDSVKPKNRERVLLAIKQSNYQPNLLARQLRTAKTRMLLVLVSDIASHFCADVVKGIEAEAERNGYRILLCNTDSHPERSKSGLLLLSGKMVDGVITMDAASTLPELSKIIGDAPWVQCSEHTDKEISSCGIDDYQASRFAVEQFIKQGRRRIAMINYDLNYKYARLREQGYRDFINEQSISYHSVVYTNEMNYEAGKKAMKTLLTQDDKPDAIFAVADILAAGAMRAIQEAGLRVPQDIALIGFDDTELCIMTTPELSTIHQPSMEIGCQSVKLLLHKIDNPDSKSEKRVLDWHFIQRASS